MIDVILFCVSVAVLHELFHYLAYMFFYPIKPFIKITWFGFITDSKESYKLRLIDVMVISLFGILGGLIPFMFFSTPNDWLLIYLLTCCIDITIIINYIGADYKMTILEFAKEQVKILEKEMKIK